MWFIEIGRSRGSGFGGAEPIKYGEIAAWCNLTGVRLEHWELTAIVRLDGVFLEIAHGGLG